jgi:broad specificity phosphatase PhoE
LALETINWAKELESMFLRPEELESSQKIHTRVSPCLEVLVQSPINDIKVLIEVSHGGTLFVLDVLIMAMGMKPLKV